MQNRKTIFAIGLIVFLLPFLGFPLGFKSFLQIVGGLLLMFFASRKSLEKRIVKGKRIVRRREKNPVFVESHVDEASDSPPISTTQNTVSESEMEKPND